MYQTEQLPYLILVVQLPPCHAPCHLARMERIRENHSLPAPMQLGDASSGRLAFVEELLEHAGHGAA
jgi:hypothetical protein